MERFCLQLDFDFAYRDRTRSWGYGFTVHMFIKGSELGRVQESASGLEVKSSARGCFVFRSSVCIRVL